MELHIHFPAWFRGVVLRETSAGTTRAALCKSSDNVYFIFETCFEACLVS
jgi:hypothetical protein